MRGRSIRGCARGLPIDVRWALVMTVAMPAALRALAEETRDPAPSYVVVASQRTWEDAQWRPVVQRLREQHDAALVVADSPRAAVPVLSRSMPRYICWVARPEELGRQAIVETHRALRRLDDDPYTDAIWGIITGYDAADALRLATRQEPLDVRRVLSGTGSTNLNAYDEGIKFDEGRAGGRWVRRAGQDVVFDDDFPADSTKGLVDALNDFAPDVFITSGHATERDWQIGYSYKDGCLRCAGGQLYGQDTHGKRHRVQSPNSKVFLGMGNCLIGNIPDRDCMALAMIHTAGVDQFYGYTAVTFFGYMGWGIRDYFDAQAGRFTLAESAFAVNQALLHELLQKYPDKATIDFEHYDHHRLDSLFAAHGLKDQQLIGLLWDRDVMAFYGDPAREVRRPANELPWRQELSSVGNTFTLTLTATRDGNWGPKPVIHFLPHRVRDAHVTQGEELMPVITDNFVLVPLSGAFKTGDVVRIVFEARIAEAVPCSAKTPPVVVAPSGTPAANETPAQPQPPAGVPVPYRDSVSRALREAGENAVELRKAIESARADQRAAMCFLVGNMPTRDAQSLSSDYLLANVDTAYAARARMSWGESVPEELFLNYVLPYASINERRDDWRADFFKRFAPVAEPCATMSEAAARLNETIFETLGVQYHATKRPKPDQSPYESIQAGYASCTGLSILLIDACRAVGIPARFVGTPQWADGSGNHSWVEIWDGQWAFLGAAEPDPRGVDHAWFVSRAARAQPGNRMHAIFAASFRRTDAHFPLVWDLARRDVPALDVTRRYSDAVPVAFQALDRQDDNRPVAGRVIVIWQDEPYAVAEVTAESGARDTVRLPRNTPLRLAFEGANGQVVRRTLRIDQPKETVITIDASPP